MIVDLLETSTALRRRDRQLRPFERRLARGIAPVFRAQGRVFVRELRPFASLFPTFVQESIGANLWMQAWLTTIRLTNQRMTDLLNRAITATFQIGIGDAERMIQIAPSFNVRSPEVVRWLDQYAAQRVTLINDTTRETIRRIMVQGADEGWSYTAMTEAITQRFAAFGASTPQRRSRAELIAVTELANAYGEASRQTAQRAQAVGIRLEHRWLTTGDDRVSDGCRANGAAGWLPFDTPFPSGDQQEPRFPGCRCTVLTRRRPDQ